MSLAVDDRTAKYIVAVHPNFEDLRQVAPRLAGVFVLAATGSKDESPPHPLLESAKQTSDLATQGVMRAGALTTDRSRAHHRHIVGASASLAVALASCDSWPIDIDAALVPLRAAYSSLQSASRQLPGFQMV